MSAHFIPRNRKRSRPVEHRQIVIAGNRVVEIETRHLIDTLWSARGLVSAPLPTGPRISRPVEIHGVGLSEEDAVTDLCAKVAKLGGVVGRLSFPPIAS